MIVDEDPKMLEKIQTMEYEIIKLRSELGFYQRKNKENSLSTSSTTSSNSQSTHNDMDIRELREELNQAKLEIKSLKAIKHDSVLNAASIERSKGHFICIKYKIHFLLYVNSTLHEHVKKEKQLEDEVFILQNKASQLRNIAMNQSTAINKIREIITKEKKNSSLELGLSVSTVSDGFGIDEEDCNFVVSLVSSLVQSKSPRNNMEGYESQLKSRDKIIRDIQENVINQNNI